MKHHHKLLLALAVLATLAAVLWGWKRGKPALVSPTLTQEEGTVGSQSGGQGKSAAALPHTAQVPAGQPLAAPGPATAPRRKFSDMTAMESIEIMKQIKTTDLNELFQMFLDAGRVEQDPMKQSALQGRLTLALQSQTPPPAFLDKMREFVINKANSTLERGLIISAFASAQTKEGAEFVLWAASSQTEPDLRQSIFASISGLGGAQPYLPPMIDSVWQNSHEAGLLNAVAMAMAQEAAPSSVELLLAAASLPDSQDDARRSAARRALPKIYRQAAVPSLAAALVSAAPGSPSQARVLDVLSQIGDKSSAQAVVGWLKSADSSVIPLVSSWLNRANFSEHKMAATDALDPSVPFRNEGVREAIRIKLASQQATTRIR